MRDATPADYPAILALNAYFVSALSPLDREGLAGLHAQAAQLRVAEQDGAVSAFLMTLREGARYGSLNYRWFASRYRRFLYVDRIVVSAAAQGRGLGSAMYRDAFDYARIHRLPVVCEFDLAPPNPASAAFHARHGFREVGRQTLANGKQVSLQARAPDAAVAPDAGRRR